MVAQRVEAQRLSPRRLRDELRVSRERMGRLVDVSARTIARWEEGDALPTNRQTLAQLAQIRVVLDLGLKVYTTDGLVTFLNTPLPVFGGRTALQLIEQDEADRVIAALAADYEGVGF